MHDPRFELTAGTLEAEDINAKRMKALDLRLAGASFRRIGVEMGIHYSTAWNYVEHMLTEYAKEPTEAVRHAEMARLDRLMLAYWPAALQGDHKAAQMVLGIMDRRARLLGLDSPQKVDISGFIRTMAVKEGLDPDQAVRDAEAIVATGGR